MMFVMLCEMVRADVVTLTWHFDLPAGVTANEVDVAAERMDDEVAWFSGGSARFLCTAFHCHWLMTCVDMSRQPRRGLTARCPPRIEDDPVEVLDDDSPPIRRRQRPARHGARPAKMYAR
ncbi:MAG TPA: hypothetical protein VKD22_16645 [Ramlibacter sp.]|nr:hypothetical protein [Ramlibacter sp.]